MRLRSVVVLLLVVPLAARADFFGASDAKMILQLTQMVKTLEEQLKTAKKAYDIGTDLYELSQGDVTSVDRVLNTDLVALMKEKGWMLDGLNTLQTLSDVDRQVTYLSGLMADAEWFTSFKSKNRTISSIEKIS